MAKRLFITGTGTDVGKTYVTALLLKKLCEAGRTAAYFKAAASGNRRDVCGKLAVGDALHVQAVSGTAQPIETMCPYVYEAAVSPHLAARQEGNPVDMAVALVQFDDLCRQYEYVTAEGSGGIFCPLRYDEKKELFLHEFIAARRLPCVLVADAGLGTINAVVLTARFMQANGLTLKGILFNRFEAGNALHEDNAAMCERCAETKVLATVQSGDTNLSLSLTALAALYE